MKSKKKKVLIVSMSGGFGHIRAGQALLDYAKEYVPGIKAEHIDIAEIDPSLKKYSVNVYNAVSKKFPWIWKVIYTYAPVFLIKSIVGARGFFDTKIKHEIYKKTPDGILFTNVIILPMLATALRKKFPTIPIGVLVTDYHAHAYYKFAGIDYYFVATPEVALGLENLGIKKEKIVVSGIPINPKFYIDHDVKNLKITHGINNDFPVVVLIASFRASDKELIHLTDGLLNQRQKMNVIVIANGNKHIYDLMEKNFSGNKSLRVVNWTNEMEEYISISDVVITKAGGLTVSECLVLKKPMIIFRPIGGQEEYNAAFIEKNNYGKEARSIDQIIAFLPSLMLYGRHQKNNTAAQEHPGKKIFHYYL